MERSTSSTAAGSDAIQVEILSLDQANRRIRSALATGDKAGEREAMKDHRSGVPRDPQAGDGVEVGEVELEVPARGHGHQHPHGQEDRGDGRPSRREGRGHGHGGGARGAGDVNVPS